MRNIVSFSPMYGKYSAAVSQRLTDAGFQLRMLQPSQISAQTINKVLDEETVAIVSGLENLDGQVMDGAPNLRVIVKHGIGVDNIDLKAAEQRGIAVYNEPGSNSDAVADLALGLMFVMARKIVLGAQTVAGGGWEKVTGTGVWGKTLGILGFGNVGRLLALRGKGLRMRVMAYDPFFNKKYADKHGIEQAEIRCILQEADFVSLHMPLMDSTRNMVDRAFLQQMKNTAILINTARGGVVNEADLYLALKNREIAGAAFDAFDREPPIGSPLFTLPNFVGTPHMGADTIDAAAKTSDMVTDTLLHALAGENTQYRVI